MKKILLIAATLLAFVSNSQVSRHRLKDPSYSWINRLVPVSKYWDSTLASFHNIYNDGAAATASNTMNFTNKTGNISQWTNNSGYVSTPYTGSFVASSFYANGTGASGFMSFGQQVGTPADNITTSSGFQLYSNAQGFLTWKRKNGGESFTRQWGGALTANRVYTFPDATGTVALLSDISAAVSNVTITVPKNTSYTLSAYEFVPADISSGTYTFTFPNAPADGALCGVKVVSVSPTYSATLKLQGSDVFNYVGGATSGNLFLLNHSIIFKYKASIGVWYGYSADISLSQLDARFAPIVSGGYIPYVSANSFTTSNSITAGNMVISTGSLGIGTNTPAYHFEMKKSLPSAVLNINVVNTSSTGFSGLGAISNDGNTFGGIDVFNTAGGVGSLYDNNTAWASFGSTVGCGIINEKTGPIIFATTTYGPQGEGMRVGANKNVSISGSSTTKVTVPTALLHLGTPTATFVPLRFNSGALVTGTNIIAGGVEFLTDKWYGTISTGTLQKEFTLNDQALTAGRVPFTVNGRLTDNSTFLFSTTSGLNSNSITATTFSTTNLIATSTSTFNGQITANAGLTSTSNITAQNIFANGEVQANTVRPITANDLNIMSRSSSSVNLIFFNNSNGASNPLESARINSVGVLGIGKGSSTTTLATVGLHSAKGLSVEATSTLTGLQNNGAFNTSTTFSAGTTGFFGAALTANTTFSATGNSSLSHIIGTKAIASSAAGAGAGTGPTIVTTGCTDLSGTLQITTGTSPAGTSTLITVTFGTAYGVAPNIILSPGNSAAASLANTTQVFADANTTTFYIVTNSLALAASTVYKWKYLIVQ